MIVSPGVRRAVRMVSRRRDAYASSLRRRGGVRMIPRAFDAVRMASVLRNRDAGAGMIVSPGAVCLVVMFAVRFDMQIRVIVLEDIQPAGGHILILELYAHHAFFFIHAHDGSNPDEPGKDSQRRLWIHSPFLLPGQ